MLTSAAQSVSPVIAIYERLANISSGMRLAAEGAAWDKAVKLGVQLAESIEELRGAYSANEEPRDGEERELRFKLLSQILANDAAVRKIAEPEMSRVGELLKTIKSQKSMLNAYGLPDQSSRPS